MLVFITSLSSVLVYCTGPSRSKEALALLQLLSHSVLTLLGLLTLSMEPWPLQTKYLYMDWPHHPMSALLEYYYLIQTSYYIQQFYILLTSPARKDYLQYTLHHCLTLLMLFMSYSQSHMRIGLCILLLHDASDALLYLSKWYHYHSQELHTLLSFTVFALGFLVTRLVFLPVLIHSVFTEPQVYIPEAVAHNGTQLLFWKTGLLTLQMLHVYWFTLIVKMCVRTIKVGRVEGDIRSDDDEEEQHLD